MLPLTPTDVMVVELGGDESAAATCSTLTVVNVVLKVHW